MIKTRYFRPAFVFALLAATAAPALAQNQPPSMASGPTADRLAQQVRILTADPRNLDALLTAGELSSRLGDTSAALAFFARAESVDPANPRVFAGRGSVMVQSERPGEALRMFNMAEQAGMPADRFAADRGFAYDLLGAPELAQRDYRLALQHGNDDDTVRHLALSLGIVGKSDEAMTLLDPLLRRSDRAAWRARAFILAMNGDVAGAEKIATSMMPANMGTALAPFFHKLPSLSPADRAFAVHFGELTPTAARLADARSAPPLPSYTPDRPQLASAAPPQPVSTPAPDKGKDRRSKRERERDEAAQRDAEAKAAAAKAALAAAQPAPIPLEPPRYTPPMVQPLPGYTAAPTYTASPTPRPTPSPPPRPTPTPAPVQQLATTDPSRPPAGAAAAEVDTRVGASGSTAPSESIPLGTPPQTAPQYAPPLVAVTTPPPIERPRPTPSVVAPSHGRAGADGSLASIVDSIDVPPAERKIGTSSNKPAAKTAKADAEDEADAKPTKGGKLAKDDPKGKKGKPKPDPAKLEPARIWVQVAGGADDAALAREWTRVVAKAPATFKGKSAWTTPLHATNRVLAGPFKDDDVAQEFVNKLRKDDIASFEFTSEPGQKITKLAVKGAPKDDSDDDEDSGSKKKHGSAGKSEHGSGSGKSEHAEKSGGHGKSAPAKKETSKKKASSKKKD